MSDAFLGEMRMFAGNYAPVNWVLCNGQNPASTTDPNGNVLATVTGTFYELATAANNLKNMSAQTVGAVGGGAGHNNMMPTLAVNFIMCTAGVFPPQQ